MKLDLAALEALRERFNDHMREPSIFAPLFAAPPPLKLSTDEELMSFGSAYRFPVRVEPRLPPGVLLVLP